MRASGSRPACRIGKFAVAGLLSLTLIGALASCPLAPGDPADVVHWLHFVQLTDAHIVDEESPARAVRLDWLMGPSWRPQEAYLVQTLDATLRVLNAHHHGEQGPLDFVMVTGDLVDNAQANELSWFLDTMDGKIVTPDSGVLDGPCRPMAPEENPKLPYQTAGLDPEIPWYVAFGNHDALAQGNFAIDRAAVDPAGWSAPLFKPVARLFGLDRLDPPSQVLLPTCGQSPAIITGAQDISDPLTLELQQSVLEAGPVAADPARYFISRRIAIEAFLDTVTGPSGHGFTEQNLETRQTWYSVRPEPAAPVRLIVLDTAAPCPPYGFPVDYGVLTREQFEEFLKPEVRAARAAGEFVVIVSHHPSTDFDRRFPGDTVKTREFRRFLSWQPNVIAHICGHTHRHHVTLVPGPNRYPEIETCSVIDYPQEVRILDISYDAAAKTVILESTLLSHMDDPTQLSAESFRRASVDAQATTAKKEGYPPELFPEDWWSRDGDAEKGLFQEDETLAEFNYGRPEDRTFTLRLYRPAMSLDGQKSLP
jgi:3',5'-cyclic AMP phosphodiesterase CpdA